MDKSLTTWPAWYSWVQMFRRSEGVSRGAAVVRSLGELGDEVERFRTAGEAVSDELLAVLVGNTITEEAPRCNQ